MKRIAVVGMLCALFAITMGELNAAADRNPWEGDGPSWMGPGSGLVTVARSAVRMTDERTSKDATDDCGDCAKWSDHDLSGKWYGAYVVYTGDAVCDGYIGTSEVPAEIGHCIRCFEGDPVYCPPDTYHTDYEFDTAGEADAYIDGITACGDCDFTFRELAANIVKGEASFIARVIAAHPGKVWLNTDRNAVQLSGCNNATLHIPLDVALSVGVHAQLVVPFAATPLQH